MPVLLLLSRSISAGGPLRLHTRRPGLTPAPATPHPCAAPPIGQMGRWRAVASGQFHLNPQQSRRAGRTLGAGAMLHGSGVGAHAQCDTSHCCQLLVTAAQGAHPVQGQGCEERHTCRPVWENPLRKKRAQQATAEGKNPLSEALGVCGRETPGWEDWGSGQTTGASCAARLERPGGEVGPCTSPHLPLWPVAISAIAALPLP